VVESARVFAQYDRECARFRDVIEKRALFRDVIEKCARFRDVIESVRVFAM
jgi:hypothetical protein